jgi:hypothetical protein
LLSSLFAVCASSLQVTAQNHAVSAQHRVEDQPAGDARLSWEAVSAIVSIVAAGLSFYFFRLSKQIANRTVTVQAQRLLLEINKQYLSDPALFAIYDDWPRRDELLQDPRLADNLKALGYLKLNVFEIAFAALPLGDDAYDRWIAYFDDSLKRCTVMRNELSPARDFPGYPAATGESALAIWRSP